MPLTQGLTPRRLGSAAGAGHVPAGFPSTGREPGRTVSTVPWR